MREFNSLLLDDTSCHSKHHSMRIMPWETMLIANQVFIFYPSPISGLSHPLLGLGPGALGIGKNCGILLKIGKK